MSGSSPDPIDADVPLGLIDRPDRPSRLSIAPEALGELADSMATNGLLQRIGLAGPGPDGRYKIGWGDRRTAAAQLLRWPTIPARVYPHGTDMAVMKAAENQNREQLSPIEEAGNVQEQREAGQSDAAIARLFRKSDRWVRERVELLQLPPDIQAAIHTGTLPMNVARQLGAIDHDDYRRSLIDEAGRTGASEATARIWLAHYEADKTRIVSNHLTVQEITQRRTEYVVYVECDACGDKTDFRRTVARRYDEECAAAIERFIRETAAAAAAAPPDQAG